VVETLGEAWNFGWRIRCAASMTAGEGLSTGGVASIEPSSTCTRCPPMRRPARRGRVGPPTTSRASAAAVPARSYGWRAIDESDE
jgi:hypothetical protein